MTIKVIKLQNYIQYLTVVTVSLTSTATISVVVTSPLDSNVKADLLVDSTVVVVVVETVDGCVVKGGGVINTFVTFSKYSFKGVK